MSNLYQNTADYTVVFISEHYERKLWANHKLKSAQARAFEESREYILPARLDETKIPGILPTTGYLYKSKTSPKELSENIIQKLRRSSAPELDLLLKEQNTTMSWSAGNELNLHSLTFLVRKGRKIEIELAKSIAGKSKDFMEIAIMFADYYPIYSDLRVNKSSFRQGSDITPEWAGFHVIQYTAPISNGSSEGALPDDSGKLLGCVVAFKPRGN